MDATNSHHFIIDRWENDPKQTIITLSMDATLSQVVEAFEEFLYAVGYRLPDNHTIEITPKPITNEKE